MNAIGFMLYLTGAVICLCLDQHHRHQQRRAARMKGNEIPNTAKVATLRDLLRGEVQYFEQVVPPWMLGAVFCERVIPLLAKFAVVQGDTEAKELACAVRDSETPQDALRIIREYVSHEPAEEPWTLASKSQ